MWYKLASDKQNDFWIPDVIDGKSDIVKSGLINYHMKMMKCFLLGMLCCLATAVYSQSSELKYEFPDSVDSAILRGLKHARTDSVYVEFFDRKGEVNVIAVRKYRLYKGELLAAVVGSSRSIDLTGKKIPVMFSEDMQFDRNLRKHVIEGNGYVIMFTDDGKVKDEFASQ